MVRHRKRAAPVAPMGVSQAFAPSKYALPMATYKFSFMEGCLGYYLNPYMGRGGLSHILEKNTTCCSINGCCTTEENA